MGFGEKGPGGGSGETGVDTNTPHTHTLVYTHSLTHIHTHSHTCTDMCTQAPTDTLTHVHTHTFTHKYTLTYTHSHLYTCANTHTYTHVHMNIYTYTHIHTHTHSRLYTCTLTHTHTHPYSQAGPASVSTGPSPPLPALQVGRLRGTAIAPWAFRSRHGSRPAQPHGSIYTSNQLALSQEPVCSPRAKRLHS